MPVAAAIFGTRVDGLVDMVCDRARTQFAAVLAAAVAAYDAAVAGGVEATIFAAGRTLEWARTVDEELVRACKHEGLLL